MRKHRLILSAGCIAAAAAILAGAARAVEPRFVVIRPVVAETKPVSAAQAHPFVASTVRLPPIESVTPKSIDATAPFSFMPIASLQFEDFNPAPAVSLGVGAPGGDKPSIGGWISFGYPSRGF
jgi:hypothetical protein